MNEKNKASLGMLGYTFLYVVWMTLGIVLINKIQFDIWYWRGFESSFQNLVIMGIMFIIGLIPIGFLIDWDLVTT